MVKTETKTKKDPTKKEPGTELAPHSTGAAPVGSQVSTHLPASLETGSGQLPAALLTRSEKIDKIAAALALAQSEFKTVEKTSQVDFMSNKSGRVYYKYANLASVVEAVRPTLAKHKLSVSQMPVRCKGGMHITTMLMHSSGQFLQSTLSLEMISNDVKEAGTVITYGRRYALASILGIVTDEDIDAPHPDKKPEANGANKISRLCLKLYTASTKAGGTRKLTDQWLKERYKIKESAEEMTVAQLEEAIKIMDKKAAEHKTHRGKPVAKEGNGASKKTT